VSASHPAGLTLDTGALIALDRPGKSDRMQSRLTETRRRGGNVCVPAGAVAKAWRTPRQARLARLLNSHDVDIARVDPALPKLLV
jgi:hypothetical protein